MHGKPAQKLASIRCDRIVTIGYGTDVTCYQPGDVIELPLSEALAWCERGWASPIRKRSWRPIPGAAGAPVV